MAQAEISMCTPLMAVSQLSTIIATKWNSSRWDFASRQPTVTGIRSMISLAFLTKQEFLRQLIVQLLVGLTAWLILENHHLTLTISTRENKRYYKRFKQFQIGV